MRTEPYGGEAVELIQRSDGQFAELQIAPGELACGGCLEIILSLGVCSRLQCDAGPDALRGVLGALAQTTFTRPIPEQFNEAAKGPRW